MPALPGLGGEWGEEGAAPLAEYTGQAPDRWCLAGRRALARGSNADGLQELWLHPKLGVAHTALQVDHRQVRGGCTTEFPDHIARRSLAGDLPVVERWLVALEHPVLYWEVEPAAEVPVLLEWTCDFRLPGPESPEGSERFAISVTPDGRRAVIAAAGDPFHLVIDVEGAALEAVPAPAAAVRCTVRGIGRCRLRFTGAADAADLDRSRQMLERRQLAGVRRQRADHARELAAYATGITAPDAALVEGYERAKIRMDSLLAGTPGVGRSLLAPEEGADRPGRREAPRYAGAEACRIAMAQLAVGDRGSPRDVLKFLSLTQDSAGRPVEEYSTAGLARHGVESVVPAYLRLAACYADWTGELDFLSRRWAAIRRSLEFALAPDATAPEWRAARTALQPLAEALGHQEVAEALGAGAGTGAGGRPGNSPSGAAPGRSDFTDGRPTAGLERMRCLAEELRAGRGGGGSAAELSVLAVEGLWGVRPNALAGAVRLAPWLPADWDAMSLERLRVGRTVLTVRLRRRFGQVAAHVERVHGPRIHVEMALHGGPGQAVVQLDDVVLGGGSAAFEADGHHVVVWNS